MPRRGPGGGDRGDPLTTPVVRATVIATATGVPVGVIRSCSPTPPTFPPCTPPHLLNGTVDEVLAVDLFDTVGCRGRLVMCSKRPVDTALMGVAA